jgi:hypothetical protein
MSATASYTTSRIYLPGKKSLLNPSWKTASGYPFLLTTMPIVLPWVRNTFGKGTAYANMIGLIVGTGMAAGIIINDKLYNGRNCGAGEFGMIPYLDHFIEYYAAGQFFQNVHQTDGLQVYQRATERRS